MEKSKSTEKLNEKGKKVDLKMGKEDEKNKKDNGKGDNGKGDNGKGDKRDRGRSQ